MKGKMRVLRGQIWAERLGQQLQMHPLDAGEWMEQHTQILKSNRDTLSGLLRIDDDVCFLKLYRPKSLFHKILFAAGLGQPQRNFTATRDLAADGLAVPVPLASILVSQGVFLLIEALTGDGNLAELWRRQPKEDTAMQMLSSAGETLARLHGAGFAHGDCKWDNLFWNGQRVYLVDLDDAFKCKVGSPAQGRDLARFTIDAEGLGIGLPNYELFLNTYLEGVGESRRNVMTRMLPHLYRFRSQQVGMCGTRSQRLV